ncbi:MAG: LCP family protein [Armatimonadetes bacterium]|nr:LCP family protein [Anaerolineae bacterium]
MPPFEAHPKHPNENDSTVIGEPSFPVPDAPTWSQQPTVQSPAPAQTPAFVYRNSGQTSLPPPAAPPRDSAARLHQRRINRRAKGGEWAWVIIAAALFGVAVLISLSMFFVLRWSRDAQAALPTAAVAFSELPTPVDLRGDGLGSAGRIQFTDGTIVELDPWDGESRLTILLIGLDRRPQETGLAFRTDTMMLMSIDPKTNSVGLLSIPRDLYVDIPGFYGLHRINEPMVLGELREPGLGPQIAIETVQYNLAMRVNNYIIVDFKAFIGIVDAIGGIDVTIDYNIYDSSYPTMNYGYEVFSLKAGTHHLDGANALRFARTRHGDNDFRRAQRQQQTLYAIRDQVARPDGLPGLLAQAPLIWESLRANVYTGLRLEELVQVGLYLKDVPSSSIKTGVIDYNYAVPYTTASGAQVLLPNRSKIGTLMAEVFGADYAQ